MAIYLDYNATTPIREEVKRRMLEVMGPPLNSSSVHSYGRKAKLYLQNARNSVGNLINANNDQIIFTSGGTEANSMIMQSSKRPLISSVEHDAVIASSFNPEFIEVNSDGVVSLNKLESKIKLINPDIISVMWANNETGVIQPIKEIVKIAKKFKIHVHCDAVQAVGKIKIDFKSSGLNSMAISSHKIGGPVGVGALIISDPFNINPIIFGGGQERGHRSGTENLIGIVGLGSASDLVFKDSELITNIALKQKQFEKLLRDNLCDIKIFGDNVERLPNTTCVYMPHLEANAQVIALDLEGYAVSAGSACSSGKVKSSHVLKAMNAEFASNKSIRISSGWQNNQNDLEKLAHAYIELYKRSNK